MSGTRLRRALPAAVAALTLLVLAAPAQARKTKFVLLGGSHIGSQVKTNGGPNVPDKLNLAHTHGKLVPQSNGNEFTFKGRLQSKRSGDPVPALPLAALHKTQEELSWAIHWEDAGVRKDNAEFVFFNVRDAIDRLDQWKTALDAAHAAGEIPDEAYTGLVDSYKAAKHKDELAKAKSHNGKTKAAHEAIKDALEIKRAAMTTLVGPDLVEVLIPGVPDPAANWALTGGPEGSANKNDNKGNVVGQDTSKSPAEGFFSDHNFNDVPLPPPSTGLPTNGTGIGYEGTPTGNAGSPPNTSCGWWLAPLYAFEEYDPECGISDGSRIGAAGFIRNDAGKEVALFVEQIGDEDKRGTAAADFKLIRIGHFDGGASLFTLNNKDLAFGDHFLSGENGPFRAFRANLKKRGHPTTELWRPSGGSTQPIASNDAGLAGGGAVLGDGTVEATFWWGARHYTRFGGESGALVNGMNEAGVAVGQIGPLSAPHAALFEGGVAYDLNDLNVSGLSGWTLTRANDINNLGQIVGDGTFNGQQHAFELELSG